MLFFLFLLASNPYYLFFSEIYNSRTLFILQEFYFILKTFRQKFGTIKVKEHYHEKDEI